MLQLRGFLMGCAISFAVLPTPVRAQECEPREAVVRSCDWFGNCYRRTVTRCLPYGPRVYGYHARRLVDAPEVRRDEGCKPLLLREGQEAMTRAGAERSVVRHWQASVRFHFGEKYSDLQFAEPPHRLRELNDKVVPTCVRSSTNESVVGRSIDALSKGTLHAWRCSIEAKPCLAPPGALTVDLKKDED